MNFILTFYSGCGMLSTMSTLKPGIIYQAVQDHRDHPGVTDWTIYDKWGKVGSATTLTALRRKAAGRLMDRGGRPDSSHLHRGIHPDFKGDVIDRFMEGDEPCENVSIYWFVLIEAEINLEGI